MFPKKSRHTARYKKYTEKLTYNGTRQSLLADIHHATIPMYVCIICLLITMDNSRSFPKRCDFIKTLLVLSFLAAIPLFLLTGTLTQQPLEARAPLAEALAGHPQLASEAFSKGTGFVASDKRSSHIQNATKTQQHKTGFPGFASLTSQVRCGGHNAPSCDQCPQGHGAGWCNGECEWRDGACTRSSKLNHIHPDYFKIIQRYAFQPVVNQNHEHVNVIMVRAPFRENDDEDLYQFYKDEILFLGISSFESFPLKSCNPYSAKYESDYYLNMFPGFLHMMRHPEHHFPPEVKTILMSQSDFMLDEPMRYGQSHANVEKIYDFVYSGGDQVSGYKHDVFDSNLFRAPNCYSHSNTSYNNLPTSPLKSVLSILLPSLIYRT